MNSDVFCVEEFDVRVVSVGMNACLSSYTSGLDFYCLRIGLDFGTNCITDKYVQCETS